MENIVYELQCNNPLVTILKHVNQEGLQILLTSRNKGFIAKESFLSYFSDEVKSLLYSEYAKKQEIQINENEDYIKESLELENNDYNINFIKPNNTDFTYFYTESKTPQYFGVANKGKIMTLNPYLLGNFVVNHRYILGFNQSVDIYYIREFDVKLFNQFFLANSLGDNYLANKFEFNKFFCFYFVMKKLKSENDSPSLIGLDTNIYLQSESK